MKTFDGTRWNQNTNDVVNVKDFGAVGDGDTDNTGFVQNAINSMSATGGTLYFPPGEYVFQGSTVLISNMHITGDNATLRKKPNAPTSVFFVAQSGVNKGYGGSVSNITCSNIVFRGTFGSTSAMADSRTVCAFAMHHASGLLVQNCRFIECSGSGHRFDLQGCENITIRDCVFEGYDDRRPVGDYYAEDIQLDNSTKGGRSHGETSDDGYDGLPCRNVLIENNIWKPHYSEALSRQFKSATAIGHHSSVEEMHHYNIRIIGNTFIDSVLSPSSDYSGTIHFASWKNVTIQGNIFNGNGNPIHAINIQGTTRAIPVSNVGNDNGGIDLTTHQMCSDINILDNTFENCIDPAAGLGIIKIYREAVSFNRDHTNIKILGNTFKNNKDASSPAGNTGLAGIYARNVSNLQIGYNTVSMTKRMVQAYSCSNTKIFQNSVQNCTSALVAIEQSFNTEVKNNNFSKYSGSPIIQLVDDVSPVVESNQIKIGGGGIVHIRVKNCKRPRVINNQVEATTATDFGSSGAMSSRAIELSGTTSDATVTGNDITRSNAPVSIIDTATALVNDRNTVFTTS